MAKGIFIRGFLNSIKYYLMLAKGYWAIVHQMRFGTYGLPSSPTKLVVQR
tara:strand:- start:582 stop:731 length:150 start_codon:yes stop_codon:yes gene_type:complete